MTDAAGWLSHEAALAVVNSVETIPSTNPTQRWLSHEAALAVVNSVET
jgi:hypothetical protein